MSKGLSQRTVTNRSEAQALWVAEAGRCELRRQPLEPVQKGEVFVRTLFSGVSRGTENLVFQGKIPQSEWERMRGPNMEGSFTFPIKYGYASVGVVEEGPAGLIDKTVFCLYPHQNFYIVPHENVIVLPDLLPARRAVLAANMETALNIIWDAGILPGDRVAVYGAGVVGLLVAFLATRICGTETSIIDRDRQKEARASDLGLAFVEAGSLEGEFDILINASGSGEALADALDHAGQEARIVEASWYGSRLVELSLGQSFHSRRLQLISSQVGSIPPARRARWNYSRRLAKALELLCDVRLDHLISGETAFSDLEGAYPRILSSDETLCHRIRY
ncbi:zinc-dependent alcohol dehydrogenase [Peteryoungia desertarenae]|uniref:zinc-dependent alcohol dehydrogenase n=1 Tax=Peteryoungia desertarenae TaxID=1813451 RepID=UPI001FE722B4|nr:zinc-binding alcohol dehydrogenase [Peteryoungia desertarenae]